MIYLIIIDWDLYLEDELEESFVNKVLKDPWNYKINKWQEYTVIDTDKKTIAPYSRYLLKKMMSSIELKLIFVNLLITLFTLFFVFIVWASVWWEEQKKAIETMKNEVLTEIIKSKWWVIKNSTWTILNPIQKSNTWNLFNK